MRVLDGLAQAKPIFQKRSHWQHDSQDRRAVDEIISAVRNEGDAALQRFTQQFDGANLDDFRLPFTAFHEAALAVPAELKMAIKLAAKRVREFYEHQPKEGFIQQANGALLGQLVRPLEHVACYIPGGTAPLFSTVLMTAIPAQVAGVPDIVLATPPRPDGTVAPEILVAAREIGLKTVYRLGGAQAIAALAYGTESVPKVDKIVGPGNRFVVLAKQAVYGVVDIESLPGPTETLVLADGSANVHHVVADLLAQAEHLGAQPVLVTSSRELVGLINKELERQLSNLSTAAAARESIAKRGYIVVVSDLDEAVQIANAYAPEHLCLLVAEPWSLLPQVKNAGGIFVGENSMEALGDYIAGPSHVMPTGGTARFSSAVNVRDFQKVIHVVNLSAGLVQEIGPAAARMARAEGLEAHARAIESRLSTAIKNPDD